MFIVYKILLHGCISRLEKNMIKNFQETELHRCISRLETEQV